MKETRVKKLPHPNVMRSLVEFADYWKRLPSASAEEIAEIRHQTVCCDDLMNYSYEVADTNHRAWNLLYRFVGRVLFATDKLSLESPLTNP